MTIRLRNTEVAWGTVAVLMHWIMAALILTQFALGWSAAEWRLSPTKLHLFTWHKTIGLVVLGLAMLRLAWRYAAPAPSWPDNMPSWERRAARASHVFLYALILVMPVSGWVINSAANIPFSIFGLVPLPAIVSPSKLLEATAKLVHLSLFWLLLAAVLVHVGAALRHHFILQDQVLRRMLRLGRRVS